MSNTHCRFCDITVLGLYLNCPRCGKYLAPVDRGQPIPPNMPPEPFQIVEYGESWQTVAPVETGEE